MTNLNKIDAVTNVETSKESTPFLFTIVILTYNREAYIQKLLEQLSPINNVEIIIVDNNSEDRYSERAASKYTNVKVIRLEKNYGAVGRNYGIIAAQSPYIVTLDDDVWGVTSENLTAAQATFEQNNDIDCICFHVVDEKTGATTNWMHHCDHNKYSMTEFETYEISEGAAIFRKSCFDRVGLYPELFFISHEGPDLAFRIINSGAKIIYTPAIKVIHAHALEGRASWRRYYFDTRNLIWLAYRNYNIKLFFSRFILQLAAMLFYSLRDGYTQYFFKGVFDALKELKTLKSSRNPMSDLTYRRIKQMDKHRPSLLFYAKERIFKKGIKI